MTDPVLIVDNLVKTYKLGNRKIHRAVRDVSLSLTSGQTIALVGESGSGKSSLLRCILRLTTIDDGRIILQGTDITHLRPSALRPHRRQMQMVFQDSLASIDPRQRAFQVVAEPLRNFRLPSNKDTIAALFEQVGLRRDHMEMFAHQLSGGQRQRLGIARALAPRPTVLLLDEPVSALDVSVQAQVINLLLDIQARSNTAYLFVTHDLAVASHLAHHVAVMLHGRLVEIAGRDEIFSQSRHPYTQALRAAAPVAEPEIPRHVPFENACTDIRPSESGCEFHSRCPHAIARCRSERPELREVAQNHRAACHLI